MKRAPEPNLARIIYQAYPDHDLLPLDPDTDCRDLETLHEKVATGDLGDTLFQFLVTEIVEGGEGTLDGALRVITRARDDVEAVLAALEQARDDRACPPRPGQDRSPEKAVPRVIVTVSGGVADLLLKPRGLAVTLLDYDVEGAGEESLDVTMDPDGQACSIAEWPSKELVLGNKHWSLIRPAPRDLAEASSRTWACPRCRRTVRHGYEALAEVGRPHCTECEIEMDLA